MEHATEMILYEVFPLSTFKPNIWLKCPLLQKGANHLLLQKEVFP